MKKFIICLCLISSVKATSQNLVLNPSFEDTITCPIGTWAMQCRYWYSASGGSPDYFSEQPDIFCSTSYVPQNGGGYQYARTGIAYVGLATFGSTLFPSHANIREYVGGILSDTLKQGHEYCVSFYVSVAEELKYVTDGIGLYLSVDRAVDYTINTNLPFVPQISNPSGNIIYDTLNWVQISGTYIATGGEKYLTIGNFKDDANTMIDSTSATSLNAYLFIDDVSVIDCTVGINEIESYKNKISLMPNPAKDESVYKIFLNRSETGNMIVYSKLGIKLLNKQLVEGNNTISIPLSELGAGVYFVQTYVNGKNTDIRKLVVVK